MIGPRYVAREVDYGALMGRESAPGFALARVAADGSRGQELVLVRGDGEYVCMRRDGRRKIEAGNEQAVVALGRVRANAASIT